MQVRLARLFLAVFAIAVLAVAVSSPALRLSLSLELLPLMLAMIAWCRAACVPRSKSWSVATRSRPSPLFAERLLKQSGFFLH